MNAMDRTTQAWARVRLVAGRSAGRDWEVTSAIGNARVDVGSHPRCAWSVDAAGVAPRNFEFYWDGQVLWLADLYGAGGVQVDGEPLTEWRALTGRARIDFGAACMLVETSAAVALEDGHDLPADPVEENAKTRIVRSPLDEAPETPHSHPEVHSGELAVAPTRLFSGDHELSPQATRLVSSPDELAALAEPPRAGTGAQRVDAAPSPPHATPVTAPAATGDATPAVGGFAPPPPPAPKTRARARATTQTSLPPRTLILLGVTLVAAAGYLLWEPDEADVGPGHSAGDARPAKRRPTKRADDDGEAQPSGEAPPAPGAAAADAGAAQPPPARDLVVVTPVAPPTPPAEDAGTPEVPAGRGRTPAPTTTPAGEAAAVLFAGDLAEALRRYESLAADPALGPTYTAIARILRKRLAARCRDGRDTTTGAPCAAP